MVLKRYTTFVITRSSNSEVTVCQIIVDLALFSKAEQHNIASNVHLKINPDVKQKGKRWKDRLDQYLAGNMNQLCLLTTQLDL
jgi:hypothetical protein